jgi:non-ribosomal peptide synthase protein (TIGR01720 family)
MSRPGEHRCALGSLKSNIGHLDAAAGVAGVIKTVLALKHQQIPPSLHFERANPQIDFADDYFYVNTKLSDWPRSDTPRRAGVSSFGIGGTNAHLILEEAPPPAPSDPSRPWQLLLLSARSGAALDQATANIAAYFRQHPDAPLADVAYTLQVGRKAFAHRRMLLCQSVDEALTLLEKHDADRVFNAVLPNADTPPLLFLFPGQGAQYVRMAFELYQAERIFRQTVDRCAEILLPQIGRDLREILFADDDQIAAATRELNQTALTQPALFVVEYALARLLMSWGVQPTAMIGHSIGEYVAACLAGVFSLDDALMLVARRGQLIQQLPGGAMLAVLLPEQELLPLLGQDLDLAAVNSPSQCVVAGPEAAIARLEARLMAREIQARRLHTSHAFHSRMMDGAVADFAAVVRQIQLNPPRIPYLSNVTGTWISAADATDPEYWARHLRSTVRFAAGIGELLRQPRAVLLEVGPGRSLSTAIKRHPARGEQHLVHTTLRHSQDQQADSALLLTTLGQLWLAGVPIDWDAFYAAADVVERRRRVPLPTYPFERQRYWVEETQPAITDRPEPARRRELADWLYAPLWKQALPPLHDMPAESGGAWLIFADDCGLGSRVAEHLQQLGHDTILVRPGTEFGPAGDNAYTIDPESRRSYDALFQALRAQGRNVERIIHLWSVTTDESPRPEIESIQQLGCYSLIYLAQALADHGLAAAVQIGVVSNGVQRVTGAERLHAAKATLLGPCRVIPQEYPQLACRSIDIEVPPPRSWQAAALADQLIAELFATESEALVAYRGGQRWVQICEPVPQLGQDRRAIPLREGGVYLITGGLGGIGLELAHYLAQTVRARLVLVGRSAFPQRDEWQQWPASHAASDPVAYKIRRLQAIEEAGGEVMICRADVADRAAMRDVIAAAEARFGQVHGLIHAAGVGGGGVIQLQTPEKLAPTFAPKVQGTLVLAELLNNNALDFVVLCSSLRTIVGGFGTVDYCAANAFLDAFAQHASCQGRTPTIAINWDSWSEVGMSAEALRQDADEFGEQIGITPAAGVELFRRILGGGLPQVIVATNELQAEIEQEQAAALMRLQAQPALDEPAAANTRPKLNSPYVAPRTAVEQQIATIWQDLLGITPIGIEDNFFELGGDSIVSLQVAAKAKRYGLHLTPKLIFDQQTIAQLATIVEATHTPQSEQGLVVGPLPLTPIQHSFFEEQIFAPQHWNQSVMLAVPPGHDAALLERALQQLLQHHDALRLRFSETEAGWQQINSDDTRLAWSYHDLSQVPEAQRAAAVETLAAELQPRFDLASGPLVRGAFFDYGPQRSGRLLIIIHHLLIDIVSWRIVLEDLNSAYQQLQRGETIRLPEKSSSFKQWAERLVAYASSPALRQESNDWLADARQATPRLPIDDPAGANTAGSARALRLTLDALTTQALVQELPALAHVQVNEVLLTALAQTIAEWSDQPSLWVELEGHGREALFDDVDLSRTVGWFTSLFPVRLSLQGAEDPGAALQAVKQRLRRIPAGGIGYGLLRYLSGDDQIIQSLQAAPQPEIIFLYLGHVTQRAASAQELTPVAEPRGPEQHPDGQRRSVLEVSTRIAGEQLEVEWRYSANLHRAATIEALAQRYMTALRSLIDHCRTRPIGVTPTDFPDADLSQADLDDLLAQLSGGFQQ